MNLAGLSRANQEARLRDRRDTVGPTLSRFERAGASLMNAAGTFLDLVDINKNQLAVVNKLRVEAYGQHPRTATLRKRWAAMGTTVLTAALLTGMSWLVNTADNADACFGSNTTSAELKPGQGIDVIASQIPHRNTPLDAVVDNIMANNVSLVGRDEVGDLDPTKARPGQYIVSVDCSSNQDIIPAFLTFLVDLPAAGVTQQDLGSSPG